MDAKKAMPRYNLKSKSKSARSGLIFPVGRVSRLLRKGKYASRIGGASGIYLAAVLEYMTAEILEISGAAARQNKCKRITPRFIQLAIKSDVDLNEMFPNVDVYQGGVIPFINAALLPKKQIRKSRASFNGLSAPILPLIVD